MANGKLRVKGVGQLGPVVDDSVNSFVENDYVGDYLQ
jgi:hypothetical protein